MRTGSAGAARETTCPSRKGRRPAARGVTAPRSASPPKPGGQTRIQEVEPWTLDHPPRPIGEEGPYQPDEEASLQQAEPALGRGRGYAGIARQIVVVDDLTGAQRTQRDEGLELPAFLDAQQLADVAFDVGLHVRREVQVASGAILDSGQLRNCEPVRRMAPAGRSPSSTICLMGLSSRGAYWISSITNGGARSRTNRSGSRLARSRVSRSSRLT